ncbi:hypothetical protein N7470_000613 [Penicillium chermesinum]|nr:hypothetical protein N7470_000613 [Penicillium chermesinum]
MVDVIVNPGLLLAGIWDERSIVTTGSFVALSSAEAATASELSSVAFRVDSDPLVLCGFDNGRFALVDGITSDVLALSGAIVMPSLDPSLDTWSATLWEDGVPLSAITDGPNEFVVLVSCSIAMFELWVSAGAVECRY